METIASVRELPASQTLQSCKLATTSSLMMSSLPLFPHGMQSELTCTVAKLMRNNEPQESAITQNALLIRLDGDSKLSVSMGLLTAQLRRAHRHSKTSVPSCLLPLKSKWTLSSSGGRQAIFCIKETEERLLAARFRVGSSHQLVVVASASRHGALGRRTMILNPTREAIEPLQRDGRSWRQNIWHVWDLVSDQVADNDYWPPIVRLLEVETPSHTRATDSYSLIQAETPSYTTTAIEENRMVPASRLCRDDNLGLSSGDDSDAPLYQKSKHLTSIASCDSDEDTPLCKRTRRAKTNSSHAENNRLSNPPDCDQKPVLARGQSLDVLSLASSSHDNKDYDYWQICELVDHSP